MMRTRRGLAALVLGLALLRATQASEAAAKPTLDLAGYQDSAGAITVLQGGDLVDPYFAMQALLLAHDNGLDVAATSANWIAWLAPRQKLDGTFDRFCRRGPVWLGCRPADADDSLLALWLHLLELDPAVLKKNPALRESHARATHTLSALYQPSEGIYLVSPVFQHGLFMDNLEVWSYLEASQPRSPRTRALGQAIFQTFWDASRDRFLVSTQPEQRSVPPSFYPEHVAQIFPLLFGFPLLPVDAQDYYRAWMRQHRAAWLDQVHHDFAWGVLAVLALQRGDSATARCWMTTAGRYRHSSHWAVTDEAAYQILTHRGIEPFGEAGCPPADYEPGEKASTDKYP